MLSWLYIYSYTFNFAASDAVYRKCGTGQPLGSSSECTKIAINNQDANACWCKVTFLKAKIFYNYDGYVRNG